MNTEDFALRIGEFQNLPRIEDSSIFGNFDGISEHGAAAFVHGWAYDSAAPHEPCEVVVMAQGRTIGRGVAKLSRLDVSAAGVPTTNVGFHILLRPGERDKNFQIHILSKGEDRVLVEVTLPRSLPYRNLCKEDVTIAFRLLFGRDPESDDIIEYQLSIHRTKDSLFENLFKSPEFLEKNPELVSCIKSTKIGV